MDDSTGSSRSSTHGALATRMVIGCRIDAEEEEQRQQQGRPAQPTAAALVPVAGPSPSTQLRKKVVWECASCEKACFPIRAESRCLCNHRSVRCWTRWELNRIGVGSHMYTHTVHPCSQVPTAPGRQRLRMRGERLQVPRLLLHLRRGRLHAPLPVRAINESIDGGSPSSSALKKSADPPHPSTTGASTRRPSTTSPRPPTRAPAPAASAPDSTGQSSGGVSSCDGTVL